MTFTMYFEQVNVSILTLYIYLNISFRCLMKGSISLHSINAWFISSFILHFGHTSSLDIPHLKRLLLTGNRLYSHFKLNSRNLLFLICSRLRLTTVFLNHVIYYIYFESLPAHSILFFFLSDFLHWYTDVL